MLKQDAAVSTHLKATKSDVRANRTEPMKLHTHFPSNDSRIMTLRQRRHELVVTRNDWFIASTFLC
jgi:hypothetical protein